MRLIGSLVLYTALVLGANGAAAADNAALDALRLGDMEKLVWTEPAVALPDAVLLDAEDGEHRLDEFSGKVLLINFWATWCAPCRAELGALDRLQAKLGGDRFQVVTIATGPNPLPAIKKLFEDEKISHLPVLRDPNQGFARPMGVLALPVSVLVDAEGREVARLIGDAVWDGPEAEALLSAMIAQP